MRVGPSDDPRGPCCAEPKFQSATVQNSSLTPHIIGAAVRMIIGRERRKNLNMQVPYRIWQIRKAICSWRAFPVTASEAKQSRASSALRPRLPSVASPLTGNRAAVSFFVIPAASGNPGERT